MERHGKARWTATIVIVVLFIAACRGSEVRRTATDRWKVRTFFDIGMRIDIPRNATVDSDPAFGLAVRLHPVSARGLHVAETQYLVTLKAERMSRSAFHEPNAGSTPAAREKQWEQWTEARHEQLSVFEEGEVSFYRYDARCAGDEVLRVDVTVRNLVSDGVPKHKAEDDRTIRRMLGSLQCFEPTEPRVSRE